MKHIKTFEDFVNENKVNEATETSYGLTEMGQDLFKFFKYADKDEYQDDMTFVQDYVVQAGIPMHAADMLIKKMKTSGFIHEVKGANENEVNESKVNESQGHALIGYIDCIRGIIENTGSKIDDKKIKAMLDSVKDMEAVLKKNLKGSGLSGW